MRRLVGVVLALCLLCLGSCSLAFQDSVRSSGTACSTSRFWYMSDFVMAAGLTYLVATNGDGEAGPYIPGGVLAASGLIGVWKRGNCVRHRETATPEQWARDSERESQRDAARAAQMRDMAARMRQPAYTPQPGTQPTYTSGPASTPPPTYTPGPTSTPRPQPTSTPPREKAALDGTCRCRGYPLGHPRAKEQRPELCTPMKSTYHDTCDSSCKAKGYAIGLANVFESC